MPSSVGQLDRLRVLVDAGDFGLVSALERDDSGFDLSTALAEGLGLVGMRERVGLVGGKLQIESAAGAATTIVAEVPSR